MLFDSLPFLIFLPVILLMYWASTHKYRWMLLLAASYFFYGSWRAEFLILIVYSTCVDYFAALQIDTTKDLLKKRIWLSISLVSNFGVLFVFKYFNFFIGERWFFKEIEAAHPKIEWMASILDYGIPVGISFYTFQTVGYTIDVYRGKTKAEKNLGKFALFVSYFPQLVAGPIERFSNLHHQIFAKHQLNYELLQKGFRLVLYGLFIKMVIADNIAPLIDPVFDNPLAYDQGSNAYALLLFSLQIYADFHGYSLIAIGVAKLMGVNLMDNFRTPYFASSIKDFWSRWHISLSNWFRDYLYIPLGGNKVTYVRWMVNIMIVFIVSGIWHGANFTFIVWGAIHGLMYLSEQMVSRSTSLRLNSPLLKGVGWIKTFLIINLAWLFFRSDNLAKAYLSLTQMFGFEVDANRYHSIVALEHSKLHDGIEQHLIHPLAELKTMTVEWYFILPLILLFITDLIIQRQRFDTVIGKAPFAVRWSVYAVLIYFIMAMSGANFYQFIYFQF